jgi:hypothetical protein
MSRYLSLIPGLILSTLCSAALAHHSRAEFTGDVIELEGELLEVDWRNPHPRFVLQVSEIPADVWEIQVYGSVASLGRAGIKASSFPVGERITVAGLASSRRQNFLLGSHALLTSGLEAVLQYNAGPHWSGDHIGGSGGERIDESALAEAAAEDRGLFRVWSVPSTETAIAAAAGFVQSIPPFTEAALAARGSWDLTDNPVTRCEQPWIPMAMFTPLAREFIDNGDTLTLRIEYLSGGVRTIHLAEPAANIFKERSRMGRSLGRWEGNTLVVETDLIDAPALDNRGTLQSPEMRVTERFTLSDDQSRLDYELVMRDPQAFQGPVTFRFQYLALGEEFLPQCEAP